MRGDRRTTALWRTAAFRLALIFAAIFGVGAALLLALLDYSIGRHAEHELRSALRHQMGIMRADAQLEGAEALVNILNEHVRTDTISRYRYLVVPVDGARFEGGVPETALAVDGFGVVDALASDGAVPGRSNRVEMLVYTERLGDGAFMAVGREVYPLADLRHGLNRIALIGSVALMILAVMAGLAAGLIFLRRLDRVNATTGRIMEGNLSERLPTIGLGQEFHDLTHNLNTMLDRLEALMSGMKQLSADLAHDLRMPLTRLRNRLEEIEAKDAAQAGRIAEALGEADELLTLFNALLRLARLEAGAARFEMVPVDLGELMDRAVETFTPGAEDLGRRLRLRRDDGDALVLGDPALLGQLLANLIDNAIDHTRPGTQVDCVVATAARSVTLRIEDDGPGVPPDEIPHLTKRFYRLDQSRTRPGAGLGLSLAAAIADLHGARMEITALSPGLSVSLRFAKAEPASLPGLFRRPETGQAEKIDGDA